MKTAHFLSSDDTFSQDLSAAALDYTTSTGRKRKVEEVAINFSQAVSEVITITLDSAKGANYDTVHVEVALVAELDFVWRPQGEMNLQSGDELHVECTNDGGVGICYVTIKTSEL